VLAAEVDGRLAPEGTSSTTSPLRWTSITWGITPSRSSAMIAGAREAVVEVLDARLGDVAKPLADQAA